MNAVRPYWVLVRREVWEHKSFWIVPAVIGCLSILFSLYGGGALIVAAHRGLVSVDLTDITTGPGRREAVYLFLLATAGFFNVVMLFMVWFYLMDSLYADRKDRSVLFWRSMPVSDTTTVLAKLFAGMVTAPALMLAAVIVTEIIVGIIFVIAAALSGLNLLGAVLVPGTIFLAWITLGFALIQQSLWLLPYWGWFLLCSAWAKKLVLAWAVLIPLGAVLVELIVFRTHYLSNAIFGHIGRGLILVSGYSVHGVQVGLPSDFEGRLSGASGAHILSLTSVAHMFTLSEMWIGVGIGIIFVLGAIWLRRHRAEI